MKDFVKIVEVGPRDGLQNEASFLATNDKLKLIEMLLAAGLSTIEVTSFVKGSAIPQMKDHSELFSDLKSSLGQNFNDHHFPVLVPNERGLDNALKVGVREVSLFSATSEAFTKKNINATIEESFKRFETVVKKANNFNLKIRGYISTAFYCPYEGKMAFEKTLEISKRFLDLGAYEISIGDTIGMATPNEVEDMIQMIENEIDLKQVAMHFHDTRGMAIANILKSLDCGIRIFDSSVGGLGGCPYADGASGNVATEEVNFLLTRMGYRTKIDQAKLYEAALFVVNKLEKKKSKLLEANSK